MKGSLSGHRSVSVNGNWLLTFAFESGVPSWSITRIAHEVHMSPMFNPTYPGLTLRDDILPA